jgi:hypothetical protein
VRPYFSDSCFIHGFAKENIVTHLIPVIGDIWRDNAWQSIGVLVGIVTWLLTPFLSAWFERFLNKEKDQHQSAIRGLAGAYKALLLTEEPLGCLGFFGLLPLQLADSYLLYLLAQRVFLWTHIDQTALFVTCVAIVVTVTWVLCIIRHSKLAFVIVWHFLAIAFLFSLLQVSLRNATFQVRDLTFIKQWIGQYLPTSITQQPFFLGIHLNAVPIDVRFSQPASIQAQFIWMYVLTFSLTFFLYNLSKGRQARRMNAFAYMSEERKRAVLAELDKRDKEITLELKALDKQDKEADITLKQQQNTFTLDREKLALEREQLALEATKLDLEKKRAEYTLELAQMIVETIHEDVSRQEVRIELIRLTLPSLRDLGHKNGTEVILDHLQAIQRSTSFLLPASSVSLDQGDSYDKSAILAGSDVQSTTANQTISSASPTATD